HAPRSVGSGCTACPPSRSVGVIGYLRGELIDRTIDELLIVVSGVGYRVLVAPALASSVGSVGEEVAVHVHHHVREDAHTLYGFATVEDRRLFEVLLSAHGVGPALAQAILATLPPPQLQAAFTSNDVTALCAVPGVGKKTAARLILDVGPKIVGASLDGVVGVPGPTGAPSLRSDVHDALAELGYGPDEIRRAMIDLPSDGEVSDLLREALQRLAA
ncbi:MAG: Holliday junction branch migration protein RuvA, partial [Actinomycetes bacterium]